MCISLKTGYLSRIKKLRKSWIPVATTKKRCYKIFQTNSAELNPHNHMRLLYFKSSVKSQKERFLYMVKSLVHTIKTKILKYLSVLRTRITPNTEAFYAVTSINLYLIAAYRSIIDCPIFSHYKYLGDQSSTFDHI